MNQSSKGMRFGPFELDPGTGELRKNGIKIKLPTQAVQLLVLLAERPGDLVSREEIRLALWPNETVVEWEHSINTAVKRIRTALGDSPEKPRYVETLRGRGYRFVAKVETFGRIPAALIPIASPVRPSDPMGRQVSHYRVLEVLGKGGMGVVYRAEDVRLGRQVALKFLPLEQAADPTAVSRFEREARMASALNHPNICTVYDVEIETSGAFIAMELLEGETLRDQIRRLSGAFSTEQIVEIGVQIADAIEAAHECGIIHRDIKPANIFLTKRGEVKVLDFGLAKPAPRRLRKEAAPHELGSGDLTSSGDTPGTAAYMSPEQARGEELDGRTDLYSFGAVLYEVATGEQAGRHFQSASMPPAGGAYRPPKLWEIIVRLLERDRDLRYQTAGDVASELRRLKRDLSTAAPLPAPAQRETVAPLKSRRAPGLIAVAASALALALLAWWLYPRSARREAPPLAERLTSDPGYQVGADFSPDGTQVVYSWNGYQGNNYDLYTLTIGESQPRRLTTDPDVEYSPAWSPDGKLIAFLKGPPEGVASLMLMPASGGPARKLRDTAMGVAPLFKRIEWSRDGRWIVMEDDTSPENGFELVVVSVSTGQRHRLTSPHPNQGDMQPAVSPDGRTLAFIRDVGNGVGLPYLLPLTADMNAGGEPQELSLPKFENNSINYPRWLPDGRELIFISNRGGNGRVWETTVEGSAEPSILASAGEDISLPVISRDGKRLLFSRFSVEANIWSNPVEGPGKPGKLDSLTPTDSTLDFSPDGSQITFESRRSGSSEIWVSDRNGGSPRKLTNYNGPGTGSPRWSPDGKWIAYDSRVEGQPDIYVVPSAGGEPERLTKDPSVDVMPIWSPNGEWIYFCSGRSGTRQVWRLPSHGGVAEQITRTGGCAPRITLDGKTLFYMKRTAPITSIWTVPADGGEELLALNNVVDRCFAVSKGRLYYLAKQPGDAYPSLRYMDIASRKIQIVRTLTGTPSPTLTVSPDGKSVFYRQVDRQGSNLILMNNFR